MIRKLLGYLRPEKQILLIPYQEGMLVFETGEQKKLGPCAARALELFAKHPGETLTHETIAAHVWADVRPKDWRQMVQQVVFDARLVLPRNFIVTEYQAGNKSIGYRLIQEIKVENFHAQP